ncbi:G-type lectin S-receptor-like serine/threonine-protein kinase [Hordeum vulgare]|nr:G-type lectin S-receptor-like serine/threonine-protein kinase [Hordeum vulgare]
MAADAAPPSSTIPACLLLLLFLSARAADAASLAAGLVYPGFTASGYKYIDTCGAFLESNNGAFRAAVHNPGNQLASFYLAVLHAPTGTPVWSVNRDAG